MYGPGIYGGPGGGIPDIIGWIKHQTDCQKSETSEGNKLVRDKHMDMVYRHSRGLPLGLPRMKEVA